MSGLPGFLRSSAAAPIQTVSGPVRAGSFGLVNQQAPWRYGLLHDRQADFLLWITRGQGRAIVGGVRHGLPMHTALFIPAGTLFSIDLPGTAQALYAESPTGLTDMLPDAPLFLRVNESLAQVELTAEIDAMARELAQHRARSLDALEARMRLLAVWLHRQAPATRETPRDSAAEKLARRFAGSVTRHFGEAWGVAQHAERLDVTATHLTRACRQASGLTAMDILMERRLHAARCALEDGKQPVQSIARSVGFSSPAYFSRFIQRKTGQSPSQIRQASRKTTL